ncbi:unnamed protein product [Medioppia subpectinata]|uniref:Uncharacterized protein n=1 Tax=Medioppia subpectinata TaxID=1979941 RepID=A0A7R9QE38_9ACAR|nr:unnamed protein product [Medioppia subpectinata]CAG2119213.1 unnamed protein product [Medioppia subpectinata]
MGFHSFLYSYHSTTACLWTAICRPNQPFERHLHTECPHSSAARSATQSAQNAPKMASQSRLPTKASHECLSHSSAPITRSTHLSSAAVTHALCVRSLVDALVATNE